jgi:superfamily II DNA or RNA helicase
MKFTFAQGKVKGRDFVGISGMKTREDFEMHDIIKKTLSRTEYMPFVQGFNKNVHESYMFYQDTVFPLQFWQDVKDNLVKLGHKVNFENENDYLANFNDISREDFNEWLQSKRFPEDIDTVSEEYKFQRDSVYKILVEKTGHANISMSGGKTFIIYLFTRYLKDHYMLPPGKQVLLVLPDKGLVKQTKNEFDKFDTFETGDKIKVSSVFSGSKQVSGADIVAGTFQSLGNYEEDFFDNIHAMICDEMHRAKMFTIRNEIYSKIRNAGYFFGLTGTVPRYNTIDYLHTTAMFGRELVKVTTRQLIDMKLATPVNVRILSLQYDEDSKLFSRRLKEKGLTGNLKYIEECGFFRSNESRIRVIAKLMNSEEFKYNTLIVANSVSYLYRIKEILDEYCPLWTIKIIHGSHEEYGEVKNRLDIIEEMKVNDGHFCIVATTQTMGTGVSIKNLENIYMPDGGKSENNVRQVFGRGMRLLPRKKDCNLFDFRDEIPGSSFLQHSIEREKIYKEQDIPYKHLKVDLSRF